MLKGKFSHKICVVFFIIVVVSITLFIGFSKNNKVEALSKYGSRGDDVRQIQQKLKNWGYYKGAVDGIAGEKTLAALGISGASNSSSSSTNSNSNNVTLLAKLIYGEARGEQYIGQVAVGAVVMNRVKSNSFPNTIAGVIYQSGAFDAVSDGQINKTPDSTAKKAAQDAINGWDPSYGAIYYFNPATATNKWIWSRPLTVVIGKHRFCK